MSRRRYPSPVPFAAPADAPDEERVSFLPPAPVVPPPEAALPPAADAAPPEPDAAPDESVMDAPAPGTTCPHCGGPMVDHGTVTGFKALARHCDTCGGCWLYSETALRWYSRPGHPWPDGWVDE